MAPVLRHCPCLRPENDDIRLLDYSHSNLEDVPNEVFGFERTLEELFLDANQIKDLPRPLFHCHGLRKLNLSDNEIQTLPPAVASLINLEQLDISKNGVLEIPDNIKGCKCLTVIDASVNPLGKLPEGFTYLINLQELYLNDTFLEYLPANFGRLSRLKILELRENHLKLLPKSMARLTELSRLDIGQNDFSDLPEVIGNLPRLVELWCDNNNLSCLPPFLGGLKKLAYLDASKNKIYEVADEIEGCISLCDLTLSSNRIKVLPDGIANLRKLSVLRVDENRITSVPENIGNLCNLEEFVMSSNNLKSLPPSLGLLRNLRTLIADDNLLEELPCEMGSCLKLTILSLRDNKLVQIPDELGHITALKVINLSGNLLQYLPFSIAKLPNLQALWLSENQNKPLIPLQSDTDRATGQKVLTCFMLPQVPLDEEVIEVEEVEVSDSVKGRQIIKFAFDTEKDQPSKLVRAPTPYPKELKAHARHARNYALKKQGSKESDSIEVPNDISQVPNKVEGLNATGATPDIMILPSGPPQESNSKVKEAVVSKPKSPLASPPRHERHYIQSIKDPVSNEIIETKQHTFLEQNPLQLSHQPSTEIPGSDISAKMLGRRDSRGDGSSSENTSTSATGSPKSTPDVALADSYNHSQKMDKDGHFRKNMPNTTGKRDTWMRQRLLRQGSGDSDRGYRSDHEVYLTEKDQYGQCYHDGYASDWEAFLAKQNYSAAPNEPMQNPQYMRTMPHGDMGYRGHAEGQEIKDGERDAYPYQWDPRFQYPNDANVDEEYHARMTPPYEGYWQMDPNSGQFYGAYDMSHSYPPGTDNPAYIYARNQRGDVPPMVSQPYYDDDGYKHPSSHFWMQRMPNPGAVVVNNPGTLPRRLGTASPRMKRSQCLSVQAPLHGSPQEYHLIPHQAANLRPPIPNSSPRPGRSPSPGIDNRVQYSPQPYPKFAPHYQPQYTAQGYPITTQPMNSVHFPPPMPNVHPSYHGNFQETPPMYPAMPPSPRMKQPTQPYVMSTVDDSALLSRPYSHLVPQPGVHGSNYYNPENIPPGQHIDAYAHSLQNPVNPDAFTKVQDAEYGLMQSATLQYRTGSIPAHIQNIENCDMNDIQHLNRSVPSINIIPSTSPPRTSYMVSASGDWRDKPNQGEVSTGGPEAKTGNAVAQNASSRDNMRTNTAAPNQAYETHFKDNTNAVEDHKICSDASQNIKNNDTHSHISAQDSFVVVSPKPSKVMNPHMVSSAPINKDMGAHSISNENQTAFRKPGCFQAVPVTIPSVHTSVRKKEVTENEQKVQYSNIEEIKSQSSNIKNVQNISEQKTESQSVTKDSHVPLEPNKQSSFVGEIVNQINSSTTGDKNVAHSDHKLVSSNVPQSTLYQNCKNEFKKLDNNSSSAKPGFPVKIANNQSSNSSQSTKDIPPDLPKKEKKALQNAAFSPNPNQTVLAMHHSQNTNNDLKIASSEKIPNTVPTVTNKDHSKHTTSGVSEHSKVLQNKIAMENSKNIKKDNCDVYPLSSNPKHAKPNVIKKDDVHESNKQCSSDKRFQKVLPPIDKTFSLKPTSARKNVSQSDVSEHSSVSNVQNVQKPEKTVECVPPNIPPKVNMHQTNVHYPEKNSNDPPMIPPKKTNLATKHMQPAPSAKENAPNRDNAPKLPSENHAQVKSLQGNEQKVLKNEEFVSKLNVDIVEVKDANNERNAQLQKGNMPDLISKIIPHEKNELILNEENKIEKNIRNENDDPANNKNHSTNKEKTNENDAPESPKSPKRQSWFFGTHKNSLVFPVIILKNPELGFSIEGGIDSPRNPAKPNDNGIYVAHVLADGPASSLLRPGDKILQVDGTDFTQLDHKKAVAVLQESGSTVSLMISRE